MMKKALVVGGNSGIGLAMVLELLQKNYEHIYVVGKDEPQESDIPSQMRALFTERTTVVTLNLVNQEYQIFSDMQDIDTLIITAGFGRVAKFEDLCDVEITNLIKCNMLSAIRIIHQYYDKLQGNDDFYCAVMGSIAGHVASPLFSVYGAAKAGLCSFIENLNIELEYFGSNNRILDVSPGSLKGTNFNGTGNDLSLVSDLAKDILAKMYAKEQLYIPQYDAVYRNVIERYTDDGQAFGLESCDYKIKNQRLSDKPQVVVGYLSGTFDLFHIGHLNLLRRAKAQCDYLIVGIHRSGSWKGKETYIPYEERVEIVQSVQYVDRVVESMDEDSDAYDQFHFDKLFVGSDYKGTERFNRYEEYFKDKGVKIVYFPYTQGTSSTQLRNAISQGKK